MTPITGDMTYPQMLEALKERYGPDVRSAEVIHRRWKHFGKGSRSPVFLIGAKYHA